MAERVSSGEKESVWKSRLFKFGFVAAVVGVAASWSNLAAAGVLIAGIGWAAWKGGSK